MIVHFLVITQIKGSQLYLVINELLYHLLIPSSYFTLYLSHALKSYLTSTALPLDKAYPELDAHVPVSQGRQDLQLQSHDTLKQRALPVLAVVREHDPLPYQYWQWSCEAKDDPQPDSEMLRRGLVV